ncbi:MAG: 5-formyltetrahydrofolate cyclo-ligase [Xanthomonadales bacterium]|jgi:5-formyltetrahydrofolate cyclo-ligase|nr:5-formyltetrahydrofolate cyclo-ligase [Xanthomonadales bacterium]
MKKVPDHHDLKTSLRQKLRMQRAGIDENRRAELDHAINSALLEHARTARLSDIAAFLAFDGEPDLSPALRELEQSGITLALPVVNEIAGRSHMTFREWTGDCKLAPNRYGILEPQGTAEIPLLRFDLVLVPLVGWDRSGGRLGMGASFYDRAFQPFAQNPRPVRMGVAYSAQESREIPIDPWDIPLHCVLTEKGWFTCVR